MTGKWRLRPRALLLAASAIGALAAAGSAAAQPLSQQEAEQLRTELQAARTEAEAARAQAADRERRIDALQRRLAAATGAPPPTEIAPPPATPGPSAAPGSSFEVYGFAMVDYIQDFNRVHPNWEATLRPSRIPTTEGQYGDDGQAVISARQSRFGVKGSTEVGGKTLSAKFEFDLYGVGVDEGQTTMRVRHAYGEWGGFLFGQTNTVFMDIDTFPNVIDYWGPNGMVFLRNPMLRYAYRSGPSEFMVALEKPGNDIDPGNVRLIDPEIAAAIQPSEKWPDITAHYRYAGDWGHVQMAGLLRYVGYDTPGTAGNAPQGHKTGWGVNLSGNFKTTGKDVFHASVVYGEGIASYMNDGGMDLGPKAITGVTQPIFPIPPGQLRPDVVPLLGLMFYYDHAWNDQWSTSIGWSQTKVDNLNFQSPDTYKDGQYASVNLLWTPNPDLLFGGELLWGTREDKNGASGDDVRLQFSGKYSFSSGNLIHQ
jgi:hypothetical protein